MFCFLSLLITWPITETFRASALLCVEHARPMVQLENIFIPAPATQLIAGSSTHLNVHSYWSLKDFVHIYFMQLFHFDICSFVGGTGTSTPAGNAQKGTGSNTGSNTTSHGTGMKRKNKPRRFSNGVNMIFNNWIEINLHQRRRKKTCHYKEDIY